MKVKILITSIENMRHFGGTLPTKRWGFCEIVRKLTVESCPHDIYADGNYGYVTIADKKVRVVSSDSVLFEIR